MVNLGFQVGALDAVVAEGSKSDSGAESE